MELWNRALAAIKKADPAALEWARSVDSQLFKRLTAKQFLREYCYVVYASGFKAKTIQTIFPNLCSSFHDFELKPLSHMRSLRRPLTIFRSERKARSFLNGAQAIAEEGWTHFQKRLSFQGVDMLMELPGIGPITKDHLAKNIGLADNVKADIWLVRAATLCGKDTPTDLVDEIREFVNESRHTIDVVIWHYGKEFSFKE